MKILLVENSEERIAKFRRNNIGHMFKWTKSPEEAKRLLRAEKWDVVSLDHDLGDKSHAPSDEKSGCEVARFLRDNPELKPQHIFLHSLYHQGVKNMLECVPEAVAKPWCWAQESENGMFDPRPEIKSSGSKLSAYGHETEVIQLKPGLNVAVDKSIAPIVLWLCSYKNTITQTSCQGGESTYTFTEPSVSFFCTNDKARVEIMHVLKTRGVFGTWWLRDRQKQNKESSKDCCWVEADTCKLHSGDDGDPIGAFYSVPKGETQETTRFWLKFSSTEYMIKIAGEIKDVMVKANMWGDGKSNHKEVELYWPW